MITTMASTGAPPIGARRSGARGFTLIEVMMSLTVLFIGVMGIVAIERAAIVSNVDARQITTATNVSRLWIERLQADSSAWNHPSSFNPNSDLSSDTAYLSKYGTGWFLPYASATPTWSAAFDINGNDIPTGAAGDIVYCANVRLTSVYQDPLCQPRPDGTAAACPATTPSMLRAEVRVYWLKTRSPIVACAGASAGSGTDTTGGDDITYHWVYTVAAIGKATAQ
ncbi:MAG: hypothetical protein NVS3B10_15190 [Polyangiales bacterium]